MDQKLLSEQCHFWPFRGFLAPFEPLGPQRDFLKNRRMPLLTCSKLQLHAKIQIISMDGRGEKSGRMDGRTDRPQNNSPPPISRGLTKYIFWKIILTILANTAPFWKFFRS